MFWFFILVQSYMFFEQWNHNHLFIIGDAPDIRPDNPAFFISGIQTDTGFDFPDTEKGNFSYEHLVSCLISYFKIH
jgi:hypothetical protein